MPKGIVKETVDWDGHKYYFICADTRREFEKLHDCTSDSNAISVTGCVVNGAEHK